MRLERGIRSIIDVIIGDDMRYIRGEVMDILS